MLNAQKLTFVERNTRHKTIIKYALCVKLCQHNFTIVIVQKLLVYGHCSESGKLSMSTGIGIYPYKNLLGIVDFPHSFSTFFYEEK